MTAGTDIFVLNESPTLVRHCIAVTPVTIPGTQIPSADTFTSLKVAPDGVRVAMIVRGKSGSMVYVTSTTVGKRNSPLIYLAQSGRFQPVGPDLDNPVSLTWWGPDHLVVLDQRHGTDQLYEVPLNGGQSLQGPDSARRDLGHRGRLDRSRRHQDDRRRHDQAGDRGLGQHRRHLAPGRPGKRAAYPG